MKEKKTAVVVGATGNLGSAIAHALKEADYELDQTWVGAGRPDVRLASSYANLPKKIDVAVYAAGTNVVRSVHELTEKEWDQVLDVNLRGAFLFAKAAFPALKAAGKATFVAISSINSTFPYPDRAAYCASKAGLEGLVRELGVEWAPHGIAAQAIRLGHLNKLMKSTKTNPAMLDAVKKKLPGHTLIPPEAVARYILWLVGGDAPWVTGSVIDFDAGYSTNLWPL
jgi:NAD(P)-dependent dehydrogenase (short-subunit alcohol dehydrogenase family)